MSEAITENIRVIIRVRPPSKREKQQSDAGAWRVVDNSSIVGTGGSAKFANMQFSFGTPPPFISDVEDKIFNAEANNDQVYDFVGKGLVLSAMEGFNGDVLPPCPHLPSHHFCVRADRQRQDVHHAGAAGEPWCCPQSDG